MAGTFALSRVDWVAGIATTVRGEDWWGIQGYGHLCHVWGCLVCRCRCSGRGRGSGGRVVGVTTVGGTESWPHQCCCPVSCAHRHWCSQEAEVVSAVPPPATGFSGAPGSAAVARGLGSGALRPLFPQLLPPLCVPMHPPSHAQMCGSL